MGTSIGVILGGVIAETLGWRYAFGILAVPGFIVAILFFWVKDYRTIKMLKTSHDGNQTVHVKMRVGDIAREFLHTSSILFTYLGYVENTFVTTALMNWLPSYFNRIDSLPMDMAGLKTSVVFLLLRDPGDGTGNPGRPPSPQPLIKEKAPCSKEQGAFSSTHPSYHSYLTENLYTVFPENHSPALITVVGKAGLLGESGKREGSMLKPERKMNVDPFP